MRSAIEWMEVCIDMLSSYTTKEHMEQFLAKSYDEIDPAEWRDIMCKHSLLLAPDSYMRLLFNRAGVTDTDVMTRLLLQLCYVCRHGRKDL